MTDEAALEVNHLNVSFGVIDVVRDVTFTIAPRRSLAIVGDNGAGKSTLLLAVAGGLANAKISGNVRANGQNCANIDDVVARRDAGISIVPEREKVFSLLTVNENLRCASGREAAAMIRTGDVFSFFPRLAERQHTLAGNLSGGEQQMLAIGMALLGTPRILLLDEPTLGLSVPVIEKLCGTLTDIRRNFSLTLLIAESEALWTRHLADESVTLDRGAIIQTPAGSDATWRSTATPKTGAPASAS